MKPDLTDAQAQQLFDSYFRSQDIDAIWLDSETEYTACAWAPSWRRPWQRLKWHWRLRTLRGFRGFSGRIPKSEHERFAELVRAQQRDTWDDSLTARHVRAWLDEEPLPSDEDRAP
jgi:hypothetical protein